MERPARVALSFASTGHGLCHASKLVLNVSLAVAAADLGVGLVRMSLALTAFNLAMGVASLPAGLLADRYGTSRVLLAFFWLLAAGALLCSLSQGYATFLVAHALLGAAAGLYHPPGMALISLTASREGMGPALGLHGVAGRCRCGEGEFVVVAARQRDFQLFFSINFGSSPIRMSASSY